MPDPDPLRYPVGPFRPIDTLTADDRRRLIAQIAALPDELEAAVTALPPEALDHPYRPGGWTARQVVHHVADSHLNAYVRVKLALTEDVPPIKTYEEQLWAELPDSRLPPDVSLQLLHALHRRFVVVLEALDAATWARTAHHPGAGKDVTVDWLLQMYAWHGRHHTAHVGLVAGA
jgi:uncharacterized damage-inducible protein DinB